MRFAHPRNILAVVTSSNGLGAEKAGIPNHPLGLDLPEKSLLPPTDQSCHFSCSSQCVSLAERREKEKNKELKKKKKKRKPPIPKVVITNLPLSEVAVWLSVVTAVL